MMSLQIDEKLKKRWPIIAIGSIQCDVHVEESGDELKTELLSLSENIKNSLKREDISKLPPIHEARKAYRALGKDPARYRLSSEALLRRIVNGKGLFFVNNIVEINNMVSLKSHQPICAFDSSQLQPPIRFTIGKTDDIYYGIGRGMMNIENLPVFEDQKGKFGSPTSDSERVKIQFSTQKLWMNIVSFSGEIQLEENLSELEKYLRKFGYAENIQSKIIT